MILKLGELRVVVFAKFAKENQTTIVTLWILSTKKRIPHSVTRWLPRYLSLPRMLQMYPASHSYLMSVDKPTAVLKRFFGNSLSELCLRQLRSFLVAFNEQVQNIKKSKTSFVEDRISRNML